MNATDEANVMQSMKEIKVEVDGLVEVFDTREVMVLHETFLFGRHLVHEKLIDIFTEMLKIEKGNDLNAIVISELGPKGKFAEYLSEMKMMVISLPRLLQDSIATIETRSSKLSIAAGIWINMIYCFCHELYHNMSLSNVQDLDNVDKDDEEERAHRYGEKMLEEIQRTMNADSPALAELPWFNTRVMEHMVQSIQAGNAVWMLQEEMAEKGLVYKNKAAEYTSLREYYKATSKSKIWENEGAPLELETELTAVFTEEIVEEPMTQGNLFGNVAPEKSKIVDQLLEQKSAGMTAEDLEDLDMQEALSESAPEGAVINEAIKNAQAHLKGANQIIIHTHKANGAHTTEVNPQTPKPVDFTEDGQPIYGSREDMQKAVLMNPGAHQMPAESIQKTCQNLWMRLYDHIFAHCGWIGGTFTELTKGVKTPVDISRHRQAVELVEAFTVTGQNNRPVTVLLAESDYKIVGLEYSGNTIPAYEITLNIAGVRSTFRLIAQNMARQSPYAQRARAGEKIAWLIDTGANKYRALIDNGVYHKMVNNKWTPIDQ